MLFRLKCVVVILGGVLGYFGYQEWHVSRGTTPQPLALELTELEKDSDISNTHIRIGKHTAVYPACVYEYQVSAGDTGDPTKSTKVNHTYYPLISTNHPFLLTIDALLDKYKDALVVVTAESTVVTMTDGAPLPTKAQQRRTLGTTVFPNGLIVCSNSALDASVGLVQQQTHGLS